MRFVTTKLGSEIIQKAYSMVSYNSVDGTSNPAGCEEIPKGSDKVFCGNPKEKIKFLTLSTDAAWCQAFVDFIVDYACSKLNIKNLMSRTASVVTSYNNNKSKFRVDDKPFPGCIGFRYTGITTNKNNKDGTKTSHSFIVYAVLDNGNTMLTIEGNSNDKVQLNGYNTKDKTFQIKDHKFIHIEEMSGGEQEVFHPFNFKEVEASEKYGTGKSIIKSYFLRREFK